MESTASAGTDWRLTVRKPAQHNPTASASVGECANRPHPPLLLLLLLLLPAGEGAPTGCSAPPAKCRCISG